jgi:hypothetical protein
MGLPGTHYCYYDGCNNFVNIYFLNMFVCKPCVFKILLPKFGKDLTLCIVNKIKFFSTYDIDLSIYYHK